MAHVHVPGSGLGHCAYCRVMLSTRQLLNCVGLFVVAAGVVACSAGDANVATAEEWLIAYEDGDVARYQSLMSPETTYECLNCG